MALPLHAASSHPTQDRTTSHVHSSDFDHTAGDAEVSEAHAGQTAAAARPTSASSDLPWFRRESWLVVMIVAFVPVCLALVAPLSLRVPLSGLTGLLLVVSVGMMLRRDRTVRTDEASARSASRSA